MLGVCLLAALGTMAAPALARSDVSRPVADIVSPIWSDPAHRDAAREVDQIVARLGIRRGMSVADVGAGSGYDTFRLASVVGPKGLVFAEDVTPGYVRRLRDSVAAAGLANVRVVEGQAGDPMLPPASVDAAIMVHMYHEVRQPMTLLAKLTVVFRPGGRLGIEELDRPIPSHGTPPKILVCELAAAGYRLTSLRPMSGDIGYFAVFKPPRDLRPGAANAAMACHA